MFDYNYGNDDVHVSFYKTHMRSIFTYLVLIYLLVPSISCSQESNQKRNYDIIDTTIIAVLPLNKVPYLADTAFKPSSLSFNELIIIDSLFNNCIKLYNSGLSKGPNAANSIDLIKHKYKRQYVAMLNNKGEKEVWINCFCNVWGVNWKNEIVYVNDGGNCYFNLRINLTTNKCFDIVVNGEA